MSRLIDADALIETLGELKQSPWYNNNLNPCWRPDAKECMEVIEYFIGKEPTVNAVPVTFIKDRIEELSEIAEYEFMANGGYIGGVEYELWGLQKLIDAWEKRKEE